MAERRLLLGLKRLSPLEEFAARARPRFA